MSSTCNVLELVKLRAAIKAEIEELRAVLKEFKDAKGDKKITDYISLRLLCPLYDVYC